MPISSHSDLSQDDLNSDIRAEDTIDITPDRSDLVSTGDEIAANFRLDNDVTSFLIDDTRSIDNTPEEGFDIFSEIEGTEFEPHAEAFLNVFNSKMLEATKSKVRRQLRDRELTANGGLSSMGWAFVAGMLSPTNLIPGGLAVKGVKQGYSVGKSAGNVAVAGGLSTALSEGILQSSQELRTTEESLLNIAAGTTISGAFGGGLAYMANRGIKGRYASVLEEAAGFDPTFRTRLDKATPEQQADLLAEANDIIIKAKTEEIDRMAKLSEEFKARVDGVDDIGAKLDELYAETRAYSGAGDLGTSDLGAAKTAKTLDDLTLRGTAARAYTGASKYLHPYTRMMTQPSPWAREMAANLFENNLILRMHETEALNSAVETNVKRWADARLASALEDIGFNGKGGVYKEMRQAGHNMDLAEFREQISKALRRNDGNAVDSDGNDLGIPTGQFNPYIMKAAKKVRDDVLEKGREELNKIGRTLESKKSKTAASYLTRVWNRKKLKEKEAEFKDPNGPVWQYLERALNTSIDKAAKRLETRIKNLQSEIHELEDAARRRDAEYKERTGVSIRELEELEQINQRLAELEDQLARGPQIDPQAAEAFGQDFLESFNRMLPPQLRLDIVDEIGGPPRPKKDYAPAVKDAANKLVDDIAQGGEVATHGPKREIAQADTPEGKAEIETYGAVGSKEWAKNKAAEARRAKQNTKTINVKDDDGTLFNLKEDYLSEDGLSSKEFIDLLHRHPVKAMMFHSLDDGKTWYDPAGLMEQRNLLTGGVDPEELTLPEIATIDKIDAFLESLPERVYTEDGALRSVNPYGKFSFEPITRTESQSGDLLHNFDLLNDGRVEVHEAPEVLAAEHGIGSGYEMFIRAKGNDGAPDVRLLVEREVHDADEVGGSIIEFEVGTKAGEKLVYDWDNDGFLEAVSEELFDFGLIKTFDSEFEPLGLSRLSVFDDSLEALGPEYRAHFVSVDGKFYSTLGSLDYIKKLPDDPQFEILKHNAEISDYMSYAARVEPEKLLERFAGRTTFEPPKNQPLLEKSLDTIENDPDGFSTDMADDVYYQQGVLKTDTPEFKEWFGDSKVVDEAGQPLVVYHGGAKGIEYFDEAKLGIASMSESARGGFFFTDNIETAKGYEDLASGTTVTQLLDEARHNEVSGRDQTFKGFPEKAKPFYDKQQALIERAEKLEADGIKDPTTTYSVYLSIKNPKIIDAKGARFIDLQDDLIHMIDGAKAEGHDGFIIKNFVDNADWGSSREATHYVVFDNTKIKSVNNRGTFDPNDPRLTYQNGATNAQGSFNPKENLIQIVKNAVDPQGSGQHELIHGLRSLKLLQDDEWALLEQSAKEFDWKGKHNIEERYKDTYLDRPDQRDNIMLEEAVAEEFAKWRQGQLEVTPEVQTIFEKILSFLQNIADSLRARGIESYEDIFELIESGDIAARGKQQLINEAEQLGGRKQQLEAQAQHAQQNELEPGLLPEDVTNALKILNDREKPKRPQTLRQFIVNEGGLLEQDGELKYRGWTNKTHPNLVKDVYIRDQVDAFGAGKRSNKKDGYTLDDMTAKAWEEGFFDERPSISDMLDALSDDMSGQFHVRGEDEQALSLFQDRMALEEELDRLGINPAKQRHLLHTGDGERDLIAAVGRVMNSQDDKKITKLRKKIDDAEFKRMSIPEKNDADEVGEIVRSVYSKLMGDDIKDDFFNENVIDFGFLKGRTFGIRDELVEQYLENDIEAVLRSYVRNISGQVEMQKRFGSMDLAPHLSKISDEFENARFKILKDKNLNDKQKQKEVDKLWKQKADVERSLKFIRDKILGRYQHDVDVNLWTRTLDGAMQVQYMMALGGVVASSLADVWRAPMTQGMGRFFGDALPQLIAANKTLKLNRDLAKKWAGIAEITNNSRLAHLIGLHDPYIQQSPAEVAVSKMTSNFSKLTGMPYWNQFWKEFSGAIVIDRALGNLNKGIDNISPKERRWLNEAGFGALSSHMPALRSSGAVEKIQGVWTINPDKFPPQLVDQFWGGVKKEIDRTIITPGFGDLPIRMHHPLGKAALQFKSFGFAADQKMTMRGMQDDMANTLAGVMGMTTVGMFIYMLKAMEAGREIDDNPMTWLTEGLDRSGAFFVFFEANNMFEKMGGPGVYYGVGARAPASRFATRNTVAGLAGPLFGSATDTAQLIGSGLSLLHPGREADATPGDIAAIRRLTPYASLPAWRWAIDNYLVPELKEEVK